MALTIHPTHIPIPYTDWTHTAKKMAIRMIAIFARILEYLSCIFPPIALCKLYNYYCNKSLNEGIHQAQLEKYSAVTHKAIPNRKEEWLKGNLSHLPEKKVDHFFHNFKNLLTEIAKGEASENIRGSLNDLVQSTVYQTLKSTTVHPAIQMLKNLSYAGTTADATKEIQEYGAKVSKGQPQGKHTLGKLARDVDAINGDPWGFNWNNPLSKAWWILTHPTYTWRATASNLFPELFNVESDNPIFQASAIKHPGSPWKSTPLTFGPTPSQPLYFDAHLPYLKENNKCEIRVILQNTKGSEGKRVKEFYRKTESYRRDGTLVLLTLPFDMRPMKNPASFMGENFTVDSFLLNYAKFILAKDGIADKSTHIDQITVDSGACRSEAFSDQKIAHPIIPANILSDKKLKSCFTLAKDIFNPIFKHANLNQKKPEIKAQVATTLQLVTQALMIFTALGKVGKGSKEIASLCIHCRMCVDRAVVLMIAMILLDYIPTAKEADLPKNIVDLTHGILVGRPEMVSNRLGLIERVKILSNFLHVFGGANFADLKSSISAALTQACRVK